MRRGVGSGVWSRPRRAGNVTEGGWGEGGGEIRGRGASFECLAEKFFISCDRA